MSPEEEVLWHQLRLLMAMIEENRWVLLDKICRELNAVDQSDFIAMILNDWNWYAKKLGKEIEEDEEARKGDLIVIRKTKGRRMHTIYRPDGEMDHYFCSYPNHVVHERAITTEWVMEKLGWDQPTQR